MLLFTAVVLVAAGLVEGSFSQMTARTIPYAAKIAVAALLFAGLVVFLFAPRGGEERGLSSDRSRVVLTPEHVQIRLEPAGLGSRFVAFTVDFALVGGRQPWSSPSSPSPSPAPPGRSCARSRCCVLTWGYHVYFEVRHQGQSPGKRIAGIRVVDGRGLPLGLEQSFVRNVVRVLDALPIGYGLGAIACHLDPRRRRLGDIAADTLVVRERRALELLAPTARARSWNSLRTPRLVRLARHRVGLEERGAAAGALPARAEPAGPGPRRAHGGRRPPLPRAPGHRRPAPLRRGDRAGARRGTRPGSARGPRGRRPARRARRTGHAASLAATLVC